MCQTDLAARLPRPASLPWHHTSIHPSFAFPSACFAQSFRLIILDCPKPYSDLFEVTATQTLLLLRLVSFPRAKASPTCSHAQAGSLLLDTPSSASPRSADAELRHLDSPVAAPSSRLALRPPSRKSTVILASSRSTVRSTSPSCPPMPPPPPPLQPQKPRRLRRNALRQTRLTFRCPARIRNKLPSIHPHTRIRTMRLNLVLRLP